jgi:hypothetical protein
MPTTARGLFTSLGILMLVGCNQILGIGDPQLDPATGGAGPGGSGASSGTAGAGAAGGSSAGGEAPCAPTASVCTAVDSDCIAVHDNVGLDNFGLRIAQMTIFKPDAFASGLEYGAITQALTMNLPDCHLAGGGTINLLVELDATTQTARIGGAKPVADPLDGYTFVNEVVEVAPQVFLNVTPAQISGVIDESTGQVETDLIDSLIVPLYLNQAATDFIMVPIRQARVYDARISDDRNCVGSFNATELDPDKACLPELNKGIKSFLEEAKLDGFVSLEEADDIIVTIFGLNRSLCVILAQDVGEFGSGSNPTVCARKGDGTIKFPGDWCSATNSPADPSCNDAARFFISFAASGVKINP